MKSVLPSIRIQDAWLLRDNASQYLHELWGEGKELPDDTWMAQRVGEYRNAWRPHEQKILKGMSEVLQLTFRQNVIDVYIAPYFNVLGDPLIIGVDQEPDLFVDILTHELIHRLLTDNTTIPFEMRLGTEWERLFGKRPYAELVHIPVNAIHTAIYLDILKNPEQLARNVAINKEYNDVPVVRAWDYVNDHGYQNIIMQVREMYRRLADDHD